MTMLNSILLEGIVSSDPVSTLRKDIYRCSFNIKTEYINKSNLSQNKSYTFPIECYGELAEMCSDYFKVGTTIRIVGRLSRDRNDMLIVLGEHIEIKQKIMKGV
jgi:single-stranded DNA-binding protein